MKRVGINGREYVRAEDAAAEVARLRRAMAVAIIGLNDFDGRNAIAGKLIVALGGKHELDWENVPELVGKP